MKKIDEKIDQYLIEEKYIDVEEKIKATLIKYTTVDSCLNCFYSLKGYEWDLTCENPEVGMIITGEKYHGQYDMMISPNGKCKFWKHGREKGK